MTRAPFLGWKGMLIDDDGSAVGIELALFASADYSRPICNRADHYILPCDFFLSSSFFPRLISAVRDWMSTILLHMANLVRI